MAMTVKKNEEEIHIQWRVADIHIPNDEILNVSEDQDIHAVPEVYAKKFIVLVLHLVKQTV